METHKDISKVMNRSFPTVFPPPLRSNDVLKNINAVMAPHPEHIAPLLSQLTISSTRRRITLSMLPRQRAQMTDLAPELLTIIYMNLDCLDDVHNFGSTCRVTRAVWKNKLLRLGIWRTVIVQSPAHRFDIQLNRMLKLHKDVVQYFETGGTPFVTTPPPNDANHSRHKFLYEEIEQAVCSTTHAQDLLPDDSVYDIIARWQGLRELQHMYLVRELEEKDYLTTSRKLSYKSFVNDWDKLRERDWDFRQGTIPVRHSTATQDYTKFDADQTCRFYSAVTYVWLINEIRWASTLYMYRSSLPASFSRASRAIHHCDEQLKKQTHTPLLDELDRLAVYKFLYHHVLPLNICALQDRDSANLPLTFPSVQGRDEASAHVLHVALAAGQVYLQPPDLIDLAIRSRLMHKDPYPALPPSHLQQQWWRPNTTAAPHLAWPSNISLGTTVFTPPYFLAFRSTLSNISRASFRHPHPIMRPTEETGLLACADWHGEWLMDRALGQFYLHARPYTESELILEQCNFEECRWAVWWWANSEEKARCKMRRWREGRVAG